MSVVKFSHIAVSLDEANELVHRWHRHHEPIQGHKFSMGALLPHDEIDRFVGAIIVGRPIAASYDNGLTLEITRCVTDGTKNACSFLYAKARTATFALGYDRLITYTRTDESGASLRAAGYRVVAQRKARSWAKESGRPRIDKSEPHERLLWEVRP